MAQSVLTLTTDFGLADHYAGAMKGVILDICPGAQIVDISHEVTPYSIAQGGYLIAQAYAYFPNQTAHVVVVDPGVGSERRAIMLEAAGQYFIAPDNGVLGMVMAREKHRIRVIQNERYFRHPVSHTFHGRDIFAPVAAHLARGVVPEEIGPVTSEAVTLDLSRPQVLHVDRFGNVITNLRARDYADRPVHLGIDGVPVAAAATHFAGHEPGALFLIEGSSGFLEVCMNRGSAAEKIGCKPGDDVRFLP